MEVILRNTSDYKTLYLLEPLISFRIKNPKVVDIKNRIGIPVEIILKFMEVRRAIIINL